MYKRKILFISIFSLILSACSARTEDVSEVTSETEVNSLVDEPLADDTIVIQEDSNDAESTISKNQDGLEEIYLHSVRKLYDEKIDLFGNQVEDMDGQDQWNHFAIYDVDGDGCDELILCWESSTVAGMWGGVFQYDYKLDGYVSEGLTEPEITFYDNGVAYEPWRHNQGWGSMWPFNASKYNPETDKYEHVLTADSWDKELNDKDFPDDIDTEGAGVVYFVDCYGEYVDYDHPIGQTEFNRIYDKYFGGAKEIEISYFVISNNGIQEYLSQSSN